MMSPKYPTMSPRQDATCSILDQLSYHGFKESTINGGRVDMDAVHPKFENASRTYTMQASKNKKSYNRDVVSSIVRHTLYIDTK